jgi:hypothetical protein
MDLKIHRPRGTCGTSGRAFVPGEVFHSALVRTAAGIERVDIAAEAWTGPPADTLAAWRSAYPAAESGGPELAPVDVLLDVLDELERNPDDAAIRYLLALQLVRRRVLRIVDAPAAEPTTDLVLACRRREREYRVRPVTAAEAAAPGTGERLTALLWSGEAA